MMHESYSINPFGNISSAEMAIRPLRDESEIVKPYVIITTENRELRCPIVEYKALDDVNSVEVSLRQRGNTYYGENTERLGDGVYLKHDGIYPTAVLFGPEVIFREDEPIAFGIMGYLGCPVETAIRHQMFDGGQRISADELKNQSNWGYSRMMEIKEYDNN